MPETAQCSACGAELAADATPEGLCPACLLKAGLPVDRVDSNDAPTVATSPGDRAVAHRVGDRLTPGQTFGPYLIGRLLGKGGMGAVYEAEELDSGRRVALKVLTHGLDDEDRARFLREGRLAASISHPHTVYVFGTDEIEGIPVIAMELAPGGTLKDQVKTQGPLPPAAAVDVILQVIAGLKAAADAGVLHRDIKPANCFVDSTGTVKVGDFGLSISTLARDDAHTQLTMTGTILGTPAFASPEQLHGEEIDVRSDIYSVGATLYYLLTGHAPFEDANVLKLATMVAQSPPPSPRQLRPSTPKGLDAVTSRCLAKQPTARVPDYERLMTELEPFGSAAPVPARMSTRVIAFSIDYLVVFAALLVASLVLAPLMGPRGPLGILPLSLVFLLNFGVAEGWRGASVGKALCGLRVHVDNHVPGLARGLLRCVVFWSLFLLPGYGLSLFEGVLGWVSEVPVPLTGLLVVFSTARRSNGFAGVHELVSGSRVAANVSRGGRTVVAVPAASWDDSGRHVGPYWVERAGGTGVVLAYDPQLRRRVWLHVSAPGTPPVSPHRRDLGRPTRLRWLGGRRRADECWDAYEAADGHSLLSGPTPPHSWEDVRYWIHDIAAELQAGLADGSLPNLALDRVWLGADGRAKLLDWPPPGTNDKRDREQLLAGSSVGARSALRFLRSVAVSLLVGRSHVTDEPGDRPSGRLLPLSATQFWRTLTQGGFDTPQRAVDALTPLLQRPVVVSASARTRHLAICGLPVVILALLRTVGSITPGLGDDASIIRAATTAVVLLTPTVLIGLTAPLFVRGGLLFRALDLAVVDARGHEVSRVRGFLRACVAWSPAVMACAPVLPALWAGLDDTALGPRAIMVMFLGFLVLVVGAGWAAFRPQRGLQDRIAGTYLVPR